MNYNRASTLAAVVVTIAVVVSSCGFTQTAPIADSGAVTVALSSGTSKPGGGSSAFESATITSITLEISASDMDTISTTISTSTLETSVDVEAGADRTFLAVVTIAGQTFNGSTTQDITAGSSSTVDIAITATGSIYTVGGTVSGLSGSGLVLQDNSGDDLAVSSNGTFRFSTLRTMSYTYDVSVLTHPSSPSQTCSVTNAGGTIVAGTTLESVAVTCSTDTYSVGGSVSGLSGTVVLQNNAGDDLSVTANGSFTFATSIADGSTYSVSVLTNPSGQTCTVSSGSGTMSGAAVTSVSVTCVSGTLYTIGGTISGLTGSVGLYEGNNNDAVTITTNGSYTFGVTHPNGFTYDISVYSPPSGQTCTVTNGAGTISGANVTNVDVSCTSSSKSWGTPALIENSDNVVSLGSSYVATGSGGDTFAVWAQQDGSGNLSIYANHKTSSGSWQASAEEIKKAGSDNVYADPRVSVDSSGNALAGWANQASVDTISITFYIASNTAWNVSEALISNPLYDAPSAGGAMFDDGEYIVIYSQADSDDWTAITEKHTSGGSLQAATEIGSSSLESSSPKTHPKVATSSNGTAIAVWVDNGNIMASNYNGGSWSGSEISIESLGGTLVDPHLAMDSSGNGVVVWYESSSINVYLNRYISGSGWQTEQIISDQTSNAWVGHAMVEIDGSGTAIATWAQNSPSSGYYDAWANHITVSNGTATGPEVISTVTVGGVAFAGPRIAIDSSGNAMAVWYQYDATRYNIWANKYTAGGSWGTAELIETADGTAYIPWVSADPTTGNFIAVWTQYDGSSFWDVYSNIYQ